MQYKVEEPGIEHSGGGVGAVLDGFKKYPTVAAKYLAKYGFIKPRQSLEDMKLQEWYPLENWMKVFQGIAEEVGFNTLYAVGRSIPANVVFPPHVTDIVSAMESVNVAYHMSHRKNGVIMFDPATGMTLSGIGSYECKRVPGENKIVCVCANPYPCDFDRGLLSAMANRWEPYARTVHDDSAPCRKKGADSCTYVITW